jgi:hypothetical protein
MLRGGVVRRVISASGLDPNVALRVVLDHIVAWTQRVVHIGAAVTVAEYERREFDA